MLRSLSSGYGMRIYTCLFVPLKPRHAYTSSLPAWSVTPTVASQPLHTSTCLGLIHKRSEKQLSGKAMVKDERNYKKQDVMSDLRLSAVEEADFDVMFPTEDTPNLMIKGLRYKDVPIVNITATMNNTIMNLNTNEGRTIATCSAGYVGFKNHRKSTSVAAQVTAVEIAKKAKKEGIYVVKVTVSGIGMGREAAVKSLVTAGLTVASITDTTPVPFNGNKPPRKRSN